MTIRFAATALLTLGLLGGCGKGTEPGAAPSASSVASEMSLPDAATAASPTAPATPDLPTLNAASYPPRDDCSDMPGWSAFRGRLEQAVASRNAEALVALMDANVQLDFGGGRGVKELRQRLDNRTYRLWDAIAALLPLGCAPQEGNATLPWIFARTPDDADPYAGMLTLGKAVPVRARPDADAAPIGVLNWAIVNVVDFQGSDKPFAKITLPGEGKTGFVETAKLRSLIDYRLLATPGAQGWRITALIAGD